MKQLHIGQTLGVCCTLLPLAAPTTAQDPVLSVQPKAFSRQLPAATTTTDWYLSGRAGDLFVLLADTAAGTTNVLGADFDLAFSPSLLVLDAGVVTPNGLANGFLQYPPTSLPAGLSIYCQVAEWNIAQGFGSLLASNVASFVGYDGGDAIVATFASPGQWPFMTGVYDQSVPFRLQALPPTTRSVRPLPPAAVPLPLSGPIGPLNSAGARFQLALRAADIGGLGVPEQVVDVRWRPLFGAVATETLPQLELRMAHSDAVPDYTIDPWTALPAFPNSGLSLQFGANAVPGTETVVYSGPYTILPQALLPSGYVPFPPLQQPFAWDGQRTLLFETRCAPSATPGPIQNHLVWHQMVFSSPQPYATVLASAGWNGQPSPLPPSSATTGEGTSSLYDLELELLRTVSVATSTWLQSQQVAPDYDAPIVSSHTPPGTSLVVEYRGRDASGTVTAWSTSPDIADLLPQLQFRVTMQADAASGAVPWIELLVVPIL